MEPVSIATFGILAAIIVPVGFYFVNGIIKRMHSQAVLEIQRDNNISRNMSISNAASMDKVVDSSNRSKKG